MVVRATGIFRPVVVRGDGGVPTPAGRGPERNYGAPKVDLGTGLGRIRDGGRPPELKGKVRKHIEGMMAARGRELTAELPPVYRKQLDSTVNSFRDAGRSEKDLAALRFAVAQKLTQLFR